MGPVKDLEASPLGELVEILGLDLPPRDIAWLDALGLRSGTRVSVLRKAPFGGPMHIRLSSGGEFALCRSLGRAIRVAPHGRAGSSVSMCPSR